MTTTIVLIFLIGYLFIAVESFTKVDKAAISLLMCVLCWTVFALGGGADGNLSHVLESSLGEAGTTIFFLMGAMAIVELVDTYGGFNFVRKLLMTTSKRSLFWRMAVMTAVMSAILDNLTTTIVMMMILGKLVDNHKDALIYTAMIVISANAGGAFSPIGDVTTIMLWNGSMLSAVGVISHVFLPAVVSFVVPGLILQHKLQGTLDPVTNFKPIKVHGEVSRRDRAEVFAIGVGGLCSVPLFHSLTGLPPFMGILIVLAVLWVFTDILHFFVKKSSASVQSVLGKIDMETILFFLGILMSVSVLSETGVLTDFGKMLSENVKSDYLQTGLIGILSSVVDNVPLVAASMKMYPVADVAMVAADPAMASLVQDGIFWQLLAYCAGTGGSLLIIGSAAGVVAMGLQNVSFGWYLKNITWIALVGYVAGIATYALQSLVF
ncbi:MAG: sodium:proton antiporter NhaD [Bacteroidales bacterium]|nr:sodium:proton antiporter NhaD [Bacteroidales bacterium]